MNEYAKIKITPRFTFTAPPPSRLNKKVVARVAVATREHAAAVERQLAEMIIHWPPNLGEPVMMMRQSDGEFLGLGKFGARKPYLWAAGAGITASRSSIAGYFYDFS